MSKMKEYLAKQDYYDGFYDGMERGIRLYAWEAEGIQYVGTGGRTLEEALDEVAKLRHSAEHSGCEPRELV